MITEAIQNLLLADAALTGLLPGGIYRWERTGRNGIGRKSTPEAYDPDGFMLPNALLRARAPVQTGELHDSDTQVQSALQSVEIYLYNDGDGDYAALEAARNRVYTLLHHTYLEGAGHLKKTDETPAFPDPVLNNADVWRIVFSVMYLEQGST